MTTWHLVFQPDGQPVSVVRADGQQEEPPAGLIRYVELAFGAWTTEAAKNPSGIASEDWPRPCMWRDVTGCTGTTHYVDHVVKPIIIDATGETVYPAGWQCDTCGGEETGGLSVMTQEWTEPNSN